MKAKSEHFTNYTEVVDWLFVQLPNYQAQGTSAYKPGLDTILKLLASIDDPHKEFKSIHLAGTNGKGSTAHMLSSVYQASGYKVGIFTSPHIQDFRERVKINGELISEGTVIDFVNQTKHTIDSLNATFFEITTALAFHVFAQAKVDMAIIETGLGGRLDSTNVLIPELSVITTIGLDHMQFLGDTIEEIAREKAGIIKDNVPVVLGNIVEVAEREIVHIANSKNSFIYKYKSVDLETDLQGNYQRDNLSVAVKAIEVLNYQFPVDYKIIQKGLSQVTSSTCFLGRYQQIGSDPKVILDAAHNLDGVKELLAQIETENTGDLHCVYGCSADKDLQEVFAVFPKNAKYYFCEFESNRSTKSEQFESLANQFELNAEVFESSLMALEAAKKSASASDTIVVFGSFFIMPPLLQGSI